MNELSEIVEQTTVNVSQNKNNLGYSNMISMETLFGFLSILRREAFQIFLWIILCFEQRSVK